MKFTKFSSEEIERRRLASVEALKEMDRAEFERWYQKRCDTFFWKNGPCCAGCDHWSSEQGDTGLCTAAPIVSGADVLHSMGITRSSYMPPPGHPYTNHDFVCGAFQDTFDRSSLGQDYLDAIGCNTPLSKKGNVNG